MENSPDQKFDTTATIRALMRTESAGRAEVAAMWPTDEMWIKRAKARKMRHRLLGRGQNETETEQGAADLQLYSACRSDGSPDLNEAEASLFVAKMAQTNVLDSDLGAAEATIKLQVMSEIEVSHTLKIPTAKQAKDCAKAMDKFVGLPHNVFANTANLQATASLWDSLGGQTTNYAGAVPIIHKDAVIREVIMALEREVAEGPDEKGF